MATLNAICGDVTSKERKHGARDEGGFTGRLDAELTNDRLFDSCVVASVSRESDVKSEGFPDEANEDLPFDETQQNDMLIIQGNSPLPYNESMVHSRGKFSTSLPDFNGSKDRAMTSNIDVSQRVSYARIDSRGSSAPLPRYQYSGQGMTNMKRSNMSGFSQERQSFITNTPLRHSLGGHKDEFPYYPSPRVTGASTSDSGGSFEYPNGSGTFPPRFPDSRAHLERQRSSREFDQSNLSQGYSMFSPPNRMYRQPTYSSESSDFRHHTEASRFQSWMRPKESTPSFTSVYPSKMNGSEDANLARKQWKGLSGDGSSFPNQSFLYPQYSVDYNRSSTFQSPSRNSRPNDIRTAHQHKSELDAKENAYGHDEKRRKRTLDSHIGHKPQGIPSTVDVSPVGSSPFGHHRMTSSISSIVALEGQNLFNDNQVEPFLGKHDDFLQSFGSFPDSNLPVNCGNNLKEAENTEIVSSSVKTRRPNQELPILEKHSDRPQSDHEDWHEDNGDTPKKPRFVNGGTSKRVRRKCTVSKCQNRVVQGGVCIAHGAKRKQCGHPGCTKHVKKAGRCSTHGPDRKRCDMVGCGKVAVQGGRCVGHGAKVKPCSLDGCAKRAILAGMCKKHHDHTKRNLLMTNDAVNVKASKYPDSPPPRYCVITTTDGSKSFSSELSAAQSPLGNEMFQDMGSIGSQSLHHDSRSGGPDLFPGIIF
eukprot:CAMPEP_0198283056 /NCGR_PEP_ID=MMETSP1449-20131203/2738_1 /TAXON_ID=420275 /ORGANISM="Attheya septentrionalis, Strain CCMP2084" /LENGTH=701 /DNA_ID=CAMNT_0043979527 /DNA_START=113 /DNA_END=2218 /DNA_ORIENTATION=-